LVLSVLSVLSLSGVAAELNFSADVDRTTVGLGEQLQLTVTVQGTNIGGVPRPQLPELPDLTQLGSTSSQSTNISFVSGRMTQQQTISFIYIFAPKKVGTLTIGPCKLDFKGSVYQTEPIALAVTKESQAPPPPPQPQMPGPFGTPAQPRSRGSSAGYVHLLATADRTSVYQGEQVTVTFNLYTRAQIGNLSIKDMPGFTGFWAEKLYDAKDLRWSATTYNGQRYNVAPLKKVALFPTQSGDLKIDKMTLSGELMVSGGFFFDSSEPFEVSSDPIGIQVKPLPEAGRPPDFCGGVGDFRLSAGLSKDSSVGGEPLTLAVEINGTGNIGLVGEPRLGPISGVKVLAPEAKQKVATPGGRVTGTRTYSFPMIPTTDGKYAVPEIKLSFFKPKTANYYTLTARPMEFFASGATGKVPLGEAESGVRVLGSDINHIKPALGSQTLLAGRRSPVAAFGWFFYPAGVVVLLAGLLVGRHRRRLEADRGYARRTRSSRLVKRRLTEATRLLASGNQDEFYAALNRAVVGYVGDRLNIEAFGMTSEELADRLSRQGVEAEAVKGLLDLIASCDAARFSPGTTACSPKETLDKARLVLETL
jgi:hypothetical protein